MIVDPDSEQLLIDYLAERLPPLGVDWPVGDRAPIGPTSYIVLIRTGGARRDLVTDQAQITIDTVSGERLGRPCGEPGAGIDQRPLGRGHAGWPSGLPGERTLRSL